MLVTPHAMVGATIGATVINPSFAIPLAITSHFVLDSIPHWQPTLYPYKPNKLTWAVLGIDLALAIYLVSYISNLHPTGAGYIWLIAVIACIPDLDSIVSIWDKPMKNKMFKFYYDWHCRIQRETSNYLGLIPQLIVILVALK